MPLNLCSFFQHIVPDRTNCISRADSVFVHVRRWEYTDYNEGYIYCRLLYASKITDISDLVVVASIIEGDIKLSDGANL